MWSLSDVTEPALTFTSLSRCCEGLRYLPVIVFSTTVLMIQTALRYRSFLWADAAQIPRCIAISFLLPVGLSGTDGIVKKQIWAESTRTSPLSEHTFPSDESMAIRIGATPAGLVSLCITIYSCVSGRKTRLDASEVARTGLFR